MDMSKTIRQPVVIAGRISACIDRLGCLKAQLAETEDELRQLLAINHELWREQGYPMTWAEAQEVRERHDPECEWRLKVDHIDGKTYCASCGADLT